MTSLYLVFQSSHQRVEELAVFFDRLVNPRHHKGYTVEECINMSTKGQNLECI